MISDLVQLIPMRAQQSVINVAVNAKKQRLENENVNAELKN